MYLYLCICICVFVFMYLYLCICILLFSCEFYTPLSSFEAKSTPRSELGLLAGDLGLPRLADWGGVQVIRMFYQDYHDHYYVRLIL